MIMKRLLDILLSLIAVICLLPVYIIISIAILLKLGRPIFFTQIRVGRNNKIFKIIKFRTMLNSRDTSDQLLPDEERITSLGNFLRTTSLDELPEFLNVLKGDMSIVGPRPLLVDYLPLYDAKQIRRHEVRPGITGWAQINGRNSISWTKRFELDVWYVDNRSLKLDIKIFFFTIVRVLKRKGISQEGNVTMERFTGFN